MAQVPDVVRQKVLRLYDSVRDLFPIRKVLLYGSYAKGRASADSDIDLLVISEGFSGKDYWERIDILSAAIYRIFEPIEAVAMTPQEWQSGDSLIADYARNGEVVYG